MLASEEFVDDLESSEFAPDLFATSAGVYEVTSAALDLQPWGWCADRACYLVRLGPGAFVSVADMVETAHRKLPRGSFVSVIGDTASVDLVAMIEGFKRDFTERDPHTDGDDIYWGFPIHVTTTGEKQPPLIADWVTLLMGPDRPEPWRKSVAVADEFLIEVRSARQLGNALRAIMGRQHHTPIYLMPKDGTTDQVALCRRAALQHPCIRACGAVPGRYGVGPLVRQG